MIVREASRAHAKEAQMGSLRKQMDDDMVVRGMSERTRQTYLSAVAAMAHVTRVSTVSQFSPVW